MSLTPELVVEPAKREELSAVRDLIIQGLTQRWGGYDSSFNPDLESFVQFYAHSLILVAKHSAGEIVGCGILMRETDDRGRIVRMSVLAERQREGIGSTILKCLLENANILGYKDVVCETTATWKSAVSFYEHQGFVPTSEIDGDQHFRLVLKKGFRANGLSAVE